LRTAGWIVRRVTARQMDEDGGGLNGLRLIGVDELSYRRHYKYVKVVVEHDRKRLVWAAEGKSAATLKRVFKDLGPERCSKLEAVTIDMSHAFINMVTETSPQARIIFDRFHVQRLALDALGATRRDEVREASPKKEKRALKGTRWPP